MTKQKSKGKKNTEKGVPKPAPKAPSAKEEGELSEDDLEQVSGGVSSCAEGQHYKQATITVRG